MFAIDLNSCTLYIYHTSDIPPVLDLFLKHLTKINMTMIISRIPNKLPPAILPITTVIGGITST